MNDAILIQHVSENCEHINLLKVSAPRHLEYCLLHKMDYELLISGETPRTGDWDKVRLIRTAMELPYRYIIYLDADTLIVDMTADLREGCTAEKIGCCRHVLTSPPYNVNLDHLNVGTLYLQNTEANRANVDSWLAGYPGTTAPPWWEQGVLNNLGIGVAIDDKYNATGNVNPSPNPVVKGFHWQGDVRQRFELMCKSIGK